jgi:predicted GNAT superfamily acetyltransferase
MQHDDRSIALEWRLAVRTLLTTYFARGYEAVDFMFSRDLGSGAYLLARRPVQ